MWGWKRYVPVAERQEKAEKKIKQMEKKGKKIEPLHISGRNIAKMFWGNLWCGHIESFSDYSNRLPRGRTYVRNGSVCHLGIQEGKIEALVSGSALYKVEVSISSLPKETWDSIKKRCAGQIGSLLELLKGKVSHQVMEVVADHQKGLFPKQGEITYSCSCPDWADMCKHVAAVLYGVGSRLDKYPEQLFLLRGVDAGELIATEGAFVAADTENVLVGTDLADIFGIELEEEQPQPKKVTGKGVRGNSKKKNIDGLTGRKLQGIRKRQGLNVLEFAEKIGVTPATIYRWESQKGKLKLNKHSREKLSKFTDSQ